MKNKFKKLRVNLQALPTALEQRAFIIRIHKARVASVDNKEDLRLLSMAHDMAWGAYGFLDENEPANIPALASDAINEVQPQIDSEVAPITNRCNSCPLRGGNCPFREFRAEAIPMLCPNLRGSIATLAMNEIGGHYEKPVDHSRDDRQIIASAWQLPNN